MGQRFDAAGSVVWQALEQDVPATSPAARAPASTLTRFYHDAENRLRVSDERAVNPSWLIASGVSPCLLDAYEELRCDASPGWLAAELAGVAADGHRAVRGSAWWFVVGEALHPIRDVALHFLGPGGAHGARRAGAVPVSAPATLTRPVQR